MRRDNKRRHEDDVDRDEDDCDLEPDSRKFSLVMRILLIASGAVLFGIVCIVGLFAITRDVKAPPKADNTPSNPLPPLPEPPPRLPAVGEAVPGKNYYSREELKALVMGKSREDVLKLLDKPDSTSEESDGYKWTYNYITKDPIAKRVDSHVTLTFKDGKVVEVRY